MKNPKVVLFTALLLSSSLCFSQKNDSNSGYEYTKIIDLKHTPVKDQAKSGTCWSFATVSFIESELLRMGKGENDLSEMFFVYNAYREKGERYVRFHGTSNLGPGGQAHDVFRIMKAKGLVTQDKYPGLYQGEQKHDHGELDAVLTGFLKAVVANEGGKISPVWSTAFKAILESYLGIPPQEPAILATNDKKLDYSMTLGINPDDYIEITSYMHHPFYSSFVLEVPDNWAGASYFNVPVDELVKIINYSLENGYTVCWDGDVSDRGFSHANGLAIIPEIQPVSNEGTEMAKWEKMSDREKIDLAYNFKELRSEKVISQEMRQQVFDNFQTTDDHLMHFVGTVKDQTGKTYFVTKNSWSDKSNSMGGYLNMSEAYVRLNTIAILVHKNAVPSYIRKKLGI